MLYSPRVTSREVNITFYQRTLLGISANQKRHYLKSYNKLSYTKLQSEMKMLLRIENTNIKMYSGYC